MGHQGQIERQSHAHVIKWLKWPIVFWLAFTSFPAGLGPVLTACHYREMQQDQHLSPKWRNPDRIERGRRTLLIAILLSAGVGIVHIAVVALAWRKWNSLLLGLRGAGWFVMAWSAFAVGIVLGFWMCPFW